MNLLDSIKHHAAQYYDEIVDMRRYLHANPELAMNEKETARFIKSKLKEYNISYTTYSGHYGIVADIKGKNHGTNVVALRADMDALPINELNDVLYKSKNEGVMHACGHDVHIASLLGTAKILNAIKDYFEGTVRLIFQPSEEMYPGGASMLIADGVLQNPDVHVIFGQHVMPTIDAGKVGVKSGKAMASTDEIFITVKGKGGHAATPELIIDPVVVASNIIVALQQIVSRKASPEIPTVLSFGRFIADGKTNIIPDEVNIEGTLRTFNEDWRSKAHELVKQICTSTAEAMGAEAIIKIVRGYPFLVNDNKLTQRFKDYASQYLGKENVLDIDLRMTAEDFAFYSQKVPACFYRLGIRNIEKGINSNIHTATFDVDECILEMATGLMCWLAIKELG